MGCCGDNSIFATESLCPFCFARIPAFRESLGNDVFLVKRCPEHGEFRTIIWRGFPEFQGWERQPNVVRTSESQTSLQRGCPFDCGICPSHRKNACTAVLEITSRCNLRCPVCFADAGSGNAPAPSLEEISDWYRRVMDAYGPDIIIQLSGGEPTVREDLPEIIKTGRNLGFSFIQVNTNGLRIAAEKGYASVLKAAGAASVFFQFDGTEVEIYLKLRGRAFYAEKRRAIDDCVENGLGVVLVPTIVPGVNTGNIGDIIRFAISLSPGVRGVHFQPVGYFGRGPEIASNSERLTLPDIMRAIEEQTHGLMRVRDFTPPGWENTLCSFHGTFITKPDGSLQAITGHGGGCCSSREGCDAHALSFTARQWSAPSPETGYCRDDIAQGDRTPGFETLDGFLDQVRTRTISVSCMTFQDAWNLDLERAKDCCIHVAAPEGGMIPFCLYNLTSVNGERLYRGRNERQTEKVSKWK